MKKIDMSSDAITKRLRQTEQLRRLSLSLMTAKPISEEKAAKMRETLTRGGEPVTNLPGDLEERTR